MFQAITTSLKALYKSVPVGFGKLYQDGKTTISIKISRNKKTVVTNKEGSYHSRQEVLKTRSFVESVKILSPILLLYPIPIVGTLPLLVAFMFPKQLLTHHFWSDEQKLLFLRDDFIIRRSHALNVYNHNRTIYQDKLLHENTMYILSLREKLNLKDLSSSHLRSLAGCNSVFNRHQWFLHISPRTVLLRKLRLQAKHIMEDDAILKSCDGNKRVSWQQIMSLTELQQFCVKRVFDVFSRDSHSHTQGYNTTTSTDNIFANSADTLNTSTEDTDQTKPSSVAIKDKTVASGGNSTTSRSHSYSDLNPDLQVYDMPPVRHETEIASMAQFFNDWMECCSLIETDNMKLPTSNDESSSDSDSDSDSHSSIILHLVALNVLRNVRIQS